MKQSSLVLLASCVTPSLAWAEWEELFPGPSLEVYDDLAIPGTELFGQTSSELTSWLPAESDFEPDELDTGPPRIFSRQSRCPVGTHSCGNGNCCPVGTNCVSGGCCQGTKTQCGTRGCVDRNSEVCCASKGTVCPKGYDCVLTGCCKSGTKPCGTKECYDPKTEVCCESRSTVCPKGYDCMKSRGCCPSGMQRCGATKCYDPQTQVCCQDDAASFWACKRGTQCCVAGKSCFDSSTERCCTVGPCPLQDACCGKECCAPGFSCHKKSGTCKPKRPPKPKPTKTSTYPCTSPTPASPQGTNTQTIKFAYIPQREVTNKLNRSETLMVSNKAVIMNMCRGIENYTGKKDGKMTLTHGEKECHKKENRKIMCPKGWCKKAVKEYLNQFFPTGAPSWAADAITAAGDMGCDEFPFASSLEGGDLDKGLRVCVPQEDNNWQGKAMQDYFNPLKTKDYIQPGHTYEIQIEGWDCDKQQPKPASSGSRRRGLLSSSLQERDAFDNEGVLRLGGAMYRGYDTSNPDLNLMPMPLGDLTAGTYTIHLNVSKGNLTYDVLDYLGQTIEATINDDGSVTFTLEEDLDAVSLSGMTEEDDVEVSYRAEKAVPLDTTATGPAPTEAIDNGASGLGPSPIAVLMVIAFLLLTFITW